MELSYGVKLNGMERTKVEAVLSFELRPVEGQ